MRSLYTHEFPSELYLTLRSVSGFVAGTNVTERNGGTHLIPGSHLWPADRFPKREETVAAEMKKGDGAFWLSTTFHSA